MHLNSPTAVDRPQARQWQPGPGRLNTRERVRSAATTAKLQAIERDWLWSQVSATGRTRLLVEHGLLPKAALGPR